MASKLDIVISCVWGFVQIFCFAMLSLYGIAYMAHSNDISFGRATSSKITILVGFIIGLLPIVLLYLDVTFSTEESK
jgi:hypothetical protein